nr:hypothetical protein [Tanacetum cinerariifolium]
MATAKDDISETIVKTMASDQNSSDPAPECQTMASDQNSFDPAPKCQTMASDQNSSDPAPECQTMALNHDSLSPAIQRQKKVTQADRTVTTSNEMDLLFSLMFNELLNGSSKVVSKFSAVSAADAPNQSQQYTTPLTNHTTPAPTYDEFINIFSNPVQDQGETSTRHVNSSNMHTFYQRRPLSLNQREGRKSNNANRTIGPQGSKQWFIHENLQKYLSGGLRWLPTGKLFDSCRNKVESEPSHGSNVDISKIHEYKQTLDLSAGTSINVPKEQNLYASTGILWNVNKENLRTMASDQNSSDPAPEYRTVTTSNELDLLFSLMFDELLNGSSKVVSKSSTVSAADASNQRQQLTTPLNNHTTPAPTCQIPTIVPTVISSENINQAETYAENDQVADEEFINIFSNPVQDQGETSTRHINSSNMHTFYQRCPLSLHQREGRKRKVSVSRQTTWYEMFDSSRTGGSGK